MQAVYYNDNAITGWTAMSFDSAVFERNEKRLQYAATLGQRRYLGVEYTAVLEL